MAVLVGLLLMAVLSACWLLTFLGMPGNWLMVLAVAVYAYLVPLGSPGDIAWMTVIVLLALAGLGEIIEFVAGAAGTAKAGGSKRGAVLALAGSIVGSICGMLIGLPIPLLGPLLAALLFAGLGAMAGAVLGEVWSGRSLDTSWQIGRAAFWGRLAGTLGKILVGAVMMATVLAALLL